MTQPSDHGKIVYKYPLPKADNLLELPTGAQLLHVDIQDGRIMLWALVDPTATATELCEIAILGTGHQYNGSPSRIAEVTLRHINSFLVDGGTFVFHAFEVVPRPMREELNDHGKDVIT